MKTGYSSEVSEAPLGRARGWIKLPERRYNPIRQILRRVGFAIAVALAVAALVMADRQGYTTPDGQPLTWLDAVYYATVTLSTTGYGDIVPISPGARLTNILVITPLRVAFLALLVGTTFEVLARGYREAVRRDRWRGSLRGHTVVIGYGTKGYNAIQQLKSSGVTQDQFVIIDEHQDIVNEANRDGYAAILGDATRSTVLRKAGVPTAERVIIASNRDDAAVLTTLTARQLNPRCVIVASIREAENEPLLLRSGADAAVLSSEAAGRLLGLAARSPAVGEVFTDLLVQGHGLELIERAVRGSEIGHTPDESEEPVIAVLRDGHALTYREVGVLARGDRVVIVGAKPRQDLPADTRREEEAEPEIQGLG